MDPVNFSIVEYFSYLKGSENSRCIQEGEEVLNAGHLIVCGRKETAKDYLKIVALCLQTSAVKDFPHTINGKFAILEGNHATVENFTCSCKVGNGGRCKHISATLLLCTRTTLNKLEEVSQTDLKCLWSLKKQEAQNLYKAVPLNEMPCFKNRNHSNINIAWNSEIEEEIRINMLSMLNQSAVALHNEGRQNFWSNSDCNDDYSTWVLGVILNQAAQSVVMIELESEIIDFVCNNCSVLFDKDPCDIAYMTKNSKTEWHLERKYRVTGSRIYEIFTYSGANWHAKSEKYFYSKNISNKYTTHGLKEEGNARKVFTEHTSLNVIETGLMVSNSNRWLGYSPDGIMFEDAPVALLEIKCPYLDNKILFIHV